jgi:cytochrome oxidase Cu insertion factor (SCO1/SenC/PrrC family)
MSPLRSRLACAVLVLIVAVVTAAAVWRWSHAASVESVQIYGVVPDFTLVDRTGRTVTRRDFIGKISVVDFFYTRCTDACPLQSAQMALLQSRYAGHRGLQLVSITVDPGHDDRQTLAAYAQRLGADPAGWLFLTGPRDVIYHLAVDGFHLAAVAMRQSPAPSRWPFPGPAMAFAHAPAPRSRVIQLAHASHFAVVDREARIIGYFDSLDTRRLENLRATLDRQMVRR